MHMLCTCNAQDALARTKSQSVSVSRVHAARTSEKVVNAQLPPVAVRNGHYGTNAFAMRP